MNGAARITVEEGSEQPFFTLRNGIEICSIIFQYIRCWVLLFAVPLTSHNVAFLFRVRIPFPQQIQSAITISLCYSYFPPYPLAHGKPLTLCVRTETGTDAVQPWACFLSVILPSVPREKLSLWTSKHYAKVLFPFPPHQDYFLVACLLA